MALTLTGSLFGAANAFEAAAFGRASPKPKLATTRRLVHVPSPLVEMVDDPYVIMSQGFDEVTLCRTDRTCRRLRQMNSFAWRYLGAKAFHGLELQEDGLFDPDEGPVNLGKKRQCIYWKGRFHHFRACLSMFCPPFEGSEITLVDQPDEVAYFQCHLWTDILGSASGGVYLEVEVLQNPDNLSMAIVDFEAGGCSSLTFSPDTGAVIRERKVQESPRKVEGAYIQPLSTLSPGHRFQGRLGFLLQEGCMAFFRRFTGPGAGLGGDAADEAQSMSWRSPGESPLSPIPHEGASIASPTQDAGIEGSTMEGDERLAAAGPGLWETTGFISDLSWASGRWLTPCLAFRNEGSYRVRITQVGGPPPLPLKAVNAAALAHEGWSSLDWEAGSADDDAND